jgi:integrase
MSMPHMRYDRTPEFPLLAATGTAGPGLTQKGKFMKEPKVPTTPEPPTLQQVFERISAKVDLPETRKRDLRSAVAIYAKIVDRPLGEIPLDLAAIRKTLEGVVPLQAKVSRKRWTNLRSDLAAAIAESNLLPMLKTADLKLSDEWEEPLKATKDKRITNGLSRFARWASSKGLRPADIDDAALPRFFTELEAQTLIRHLGFQRRNVPRLWNRLVAALPDLKLTPVEIPAKQVTWRRLSWDELPKCFRKETEEYLSWCAVPDPLDEEARARALAPQTLRLRRHYIHLAATAACEAGVKASRLTSLRKLVEPDTFKSILRHQWKQNGGKTSAHLLGLANDLIAMATEWVEVSAEQLAELKEIRGKLGKRPGGLTDKNRSLLRKLEDPRLLSRLINLPDRMWRRAKRNSPPSAYWFVDLQTALAIDILLHVPLRIEDLGAFKFDEHIHWPQGKGRPALVTIRQAKVQDSDPLEFELPAYLSDRLYAFRNEIAVAVIGRRPEYLFVSADGSRRSLSTLRVAIQRAVLRRVGIWITPHQFRHLAGKIHLDANPGHYEVVRQFLGHKTLRTTTRFYAGPNTRRAGRAHADLIRKLREPAPKPRTRRNDRAEGEERNI